MSLLILKYFNIAINVIEWRAGRGEESEGFRRYERHRERIGDEIWKITAKKHFRRRSKVSMEDFS